MWIPLFSKMSKAKDYLDLGGQQLLEEMLPIHSQTIHSMFTINDNPNNNHKKKFIK